MGKSKLVAYKHKITPQTFFADTHKPLGSSRKQQGYVNHLYPCITVESDISNFETYQLTYMRLLSMAF